MIRFALGLCLLALQAVPAPIDISTILNGIEKRYNRVQTLQVLFEQTFEAPRRGERSESGELFLRKPGRMRWQYSDPAGKLFVGDGKYFWLFVPGANRVERTKVKESDDLRAPLAFLLGRLNFDEQFKRFVGRKDGNNTWIAAEPKSDRAPFAMVRFLVTPEFEIRQVEVIGHDNSVMSYRFAAEQRNVPLPDKLFRFTPPPGVQVVEAAL